MTMSQGMGHVLTAIYMQPWLITPDGLETIIAVANRFGDPEALATKIGKPLDNTQSVSFRENGTAVIPITGPIFRYANLFTQISGATSTQILATDIQSAISDPSVKAIVLDINSPGGEATGINELAQMIFDARGKKPITAYIGGTGASAAYWIASAADSIVVDPTAVVGSIGVVMGYQDTAPRDEKNGIRKLEIVSSNAPDKRADPFTESGRANAQQIADALESVFVNSVARNRGVSVETVLNDFGRGGVKVGSAAVDSKMADQLGSLESVIANRGANSVLHKQELSMIENTSPHRAPQKVDYGWSKIAARFTNPELKPRPVDNPMSAPSRHWKEVIERMGLKKV